jgi:hypothetical protein
MAWDKKVCYTTADLKERGWTDAMIKQLLGEPDFVHNFRFGKAFLYIPLKVSTIEATPEFQTLRAEAETRRIRASKATETRKQNTLAKVGDVRLPQYEPTALIRAAVSNYNSRKLAWAERRQDWDDFQLAEADKLPLWPAWHEFRDRICVNFLRHQATSYDYLVKVKLSGKTGRDEAWRLWWSRFVEAIERQYLYLSAEARRQRVARCGQ